MTPVCIMAGGRGLRLHPLTEHEPKPLLEIGGKPIIEQVMERFAVQGFRHFTISLGYLGHLIKQHFENGSRWGWKVRYIEETEPMGTAGALSMFPRPHVPIIVQNADVLCDVTYGSLMDHHARSTCKATVCGALHQVQIPYGVIVEDDGRIVRIDEKPVSSWYVNAGVYVLEPDVLDIIEGPCDMTDVIAALEDVSLYPIRGAWRDVGTLDVLNEVRTTWHSKTTS